MNKILDVIIVIYNIKLEESSSFQMSFHKIDKLVITIVDNSSIDIIRDYNRDFANQFKICYLTMNENIGLSKGYNLAIDYIKKNKPKIKWIITLDQDTTLNDAYFDEVYSTIDKPNDSSIYYPIVNSHNDILSPKPMINYFIQGIAKSNCNVTCINSGLLFKMHFFEQFRYEKTLFLDMIDFDLFCYIIKDKQLENISKMNCTIKQEFSGARFSTCEKDYNRFKSYIIDFKTFCNKWNVPNTYKNYILLKRAFKLMIHYKYFKYIIEACKT